MMHAVTLSAGWAYAVAHCGKDVENRSWRTSHRGWIAIHASRNWGDERVEKALKRHGFELPAEADYRAVVAVAYLDRIGVIPRSRWAMPGMWQWHLSHVYALPVPVEVKGNQGVWPLPRAKARLVREQSSFHRHYWDDVVEDRHPEPAR